VEDHLVRCGTYVSSEERNRLRRLVAEGSELCLFVNAMRLIGCGGVVGSQQDAGVTGSEFEPLFLRFLCPPEMRMEVFESAVRRRAGLCLERETAWSGRGWRRRAALIRQRCEEFALTKGVSLLRFLGVLRGQQDGWVEK
jgi:hypothetical protein